MSSVQITAGVQYSISSPYPDGGYLQFPDRSSSAVATLGSYVEDISQQWAFESSDNNDSAVAIANWEFKTYVSNTDSLLSASSQPRLWYLTPADDEFHIICSDPDCSLAWAPSSEAGGDSTANEIVLAPPDTLAGAELWRIDPVGTATALPPGTASRSSTTLASLTTSSTLATSSTVPMRSSATIDSSTASSTRYPPPTRSGTPNGPIPESDVDKHLSALRNCAPCGNARCTFDPSEGPSSTTYSVLIGQPVANCNADSKESIKTTFGGTFELQHSFGVETTSSASLGLIRIGPEIGFSATVTTGTEEKIIQFQSIEVNIRPGQAGALVANVSYTTTPGRMSIDDRTLAFLSIDPQKVLEYSVLYTDCGTRFKALSLPESGCAVKSGASVSRGTSLLAFGVVFLPSVFTLL